MQLPKLPNADALRDSGFEVPNLDDMTVDPADLEQASEVLALLASYARIKAGAMKCRLSANADDNALAGDLERTLNVMYKRLPEWARW